MSFATVDAVNVNVRGAYGIINLANPSDVGKGQYSAAQIWVQNGDNVIQAGWGVSPDLYGDTITRFTTQWTADGYKSTGCFNTQCSGFVQVDPNLHLGGAFGNVSVVGGEQFTIGVTLTQDGNGNWWVVVNGNIKIGYWPKEIFTSLGNGANSARFGGLTFANSDGISPPMGNGLPPTYDLRFTCSIIDMQLVDDKLVMHPVDPSIMKTNLDTSKD
ncbi:hypothetical protein Tsubulata_045651, partial [Turnera subulata]